MGEIVRISASDGDTFDGTVAELEERFRVFVLMAIVYGETVIEAAAADTAV